MKQRITLYADEDMILTNGQNYGKIIYLAIGVDPAEYYEISEEKYKTLLFSRNEETPLQ